MKFFEWRGKKPQSDVAFSRENLLSRMKTSNFEKKCCSSVITDPFWGRRCFRFKLESYYQVLLAHFALCSERRLKSNKVKQNTLGLVWIHSCPACWRLTSSYPKCLYMEWIPKSPNTSFPSILDPRPSLHSAKYECPSLSHLNETSRMATNANMGEPSDPRRTGLRQSKIRSVSVESADISSHSACDQCHSYKWNVWIIMGESLFGFGFFQTKQIHRFRRIDQTSVTVPTETPIRTNLI